jgi:outer membrane autotransporter protein
MVVREREDSENETGTHPPPASYSVPGQCSGIKEKAGVNNVNVSGVELHGRLPGSRGEIGGGVMVTAADRYDFLVEDGYTKGSDIEQPWAVTADFRYNW